MESRNSQEPVQQTGKVVHARGIYLLPNILTTASLFSGFYAIVAAMKGHFDTAALTIFIAMIADGMDGRVARLTNTQSAFGAEYDSLADMAAFGIAPALVIYSWSLIYLGKLGWVASFLYTAATALRLARFNSRLHFVDKGYFQGLPCPWAAAVIASSVWVGSNYNISTKWFAPALAVITIIVAGLMVSTMRYNSFKNVDFKGRVPFFASVLAVLIITAIALDPPEVLFAIAYIYMISGPAVTVWRARRLSKKNKL
jgi:CDP-diacylglycerol---serine O-phosphatidyltransferase